MSQYQPHITQNANGEFYAFIVRIDRDGESHVIHGYKGRHFKTRAAAEKSTLAFIQNHCS